jgi:periplasmic protein TonB
VKEPKKLKDVKPIYPAIAKAAKMSGLIIIEAIISKEGDVKDAKILRGGQAVLEASALEAVRQWKYTPPLLNGVPVDVVMSVTVNFQLN